VNAARTRHREIPPLAAYGFRDAFNASFPGAEQQRGERDPG
jgi:hypothetical protein